MLHLWKYSIDWNVPKVYYEWLPADLKEEKLDIKRKINNQLDSLPILNMLLGNNLCNATSISTFKCLPSVNSVDIVTMLEIYDKSKSSW